MLRSSGEPANGEPDAATATTEAEGDDPAVVDDPEPSEDTDAGLTAQATPEPTDPTAVADDPTLVASDVPVGDGNGLIADIEVDQLILVLAGFSIAIGLTLSGAIRAWRRGPM